jgi:DNA-binding XRE family transcriptional regulator
MLQMHLRQFREMIGATQQEIDRLGGLRPGTVQQIEAGRNRRPAYETVVGVVRGLRKAGLVNITAEQVFPIPENEQQVA